MNNQKLILFISMFYLMNLFSGTCRQLTVQNQKGDESMVAGAVAAGGGDVKEEKKMIGSRPPSCENKCFGCMPCEAIQVPTTTGFNVNGSTLCVQYANYLPEGWMCKCGPTFYAP